MAIIGSSFRYLDAPGWKKLYYSLFGIPHISSHIKAAAVKKLLDLQAPWKVLDAGCGSGVFTSWISELMPASRVLGIDASQKAIQQASLLAERNGKANLFFELHDLSNLSFESCFDLVICLDVLEHIVDDEGVIRRLQASLIPGGKMIIHVPRRHQDQYRAFDGWVKWSDHGHVRDEYTPDEIVERLLRGNLEILSCQPTFFPAQAPFWEISTKLWSKPALNWLLFPLLLACARLGGMFPSRDGNGILIHCRRKENNEPD
jgi:SAM-dependent methyltransferase